jgi:hypothetical protein
VNTIADCCSLLIRFRVAFPLGLPEDGEPVAVTQTEKGSAAQVEGEEKEEGFLE